MSSFNHVSGSNERLALSLPFNSSSLSSASTSPRDSRRSSIVSLDENLGGSSLSDLILSQNNSPMTNELRMPLTPDRLTTNNNSLLTLSPGKYFQQDEENHEEVSEDLIHRINSRIGRPSDRRLGKQLIQKMRRMAGLDSLDNNKMVDIPNARLGLCMLSGLHDQKNKLFALNSLIEVFKQAQHSTEDAVLLVDLIEKLMEKMNITLMERETLDVQIKTTILFNILTERLLKHFAEGRLNGVSTKLKDQLAKTVETLALINRLEDPKLKFYTRCAFQDIRNLKDDEQTLYKISKRFYHVLAAGVSGYMMDANALFPHLEHACKDINVRLPEAWYNALVIAKQLAKEGEQDLVKLQAMQMLIRKKYKKLNWKFTYGCVLAMHDLCKSGLTREIRENAFNGFSASGKDFPGLMSFANCTSLAHYQDLKAIKRLDVPHWIDPNPRIRQVCAECLIDLVKNAPDKEIRKESERLLQEREQTESDQEIVKILKNREF